VSELSDGVFPASVTPFDENGEIDFPGVARLVSWFRSHECSGIVFAGTNGEGPSLSAVEKRDLVKIAVPLANEAPIVLGVTTSSLDEAIWSCESARKAGAAAALVMPPTYFKDASWEGIARWFEALLDATTLPVLAYNFPQRSGFAIVPELIDRLHPRDNFAGVKDSSGEAGNLEPFKQAAPGKKLYVGDERLLVKALDAGWNGTISGAANVIPGWLSRVAKEWTTDQESARVKHSLVEGPLKALKSSPQPTTNKAILARLGQLDRRAPRLPLLEMEDDDLAPVWQALKGFVH
jgi:4-hydroxy-tetrahydrodipicolinate synthase